MDDLLRDLRFALRVFARRPMITLTAAFCLSEGIGATAEEFSLVNAVLLQPLRYQDADELHFLWARFQQQDLERASLLPQEFVDLRQRYSQQEQAFEQIAGAVPWFYNLTGGDLPERLVAERVSTNFFSLLGVEPAVGRAFGSENEAEQPNVAILSHGLWQRRFGSGSEVLGQSLSLDGTPFEVIGIMPPDFDPLTVSNADIWVPLDPTRQLPPAQRRVTTLVRLKDDVGTGKAMSVVSSIVAAMQQDRPDDYPADSGFGLQLVSLHEDLVGDVRPLLWILLGAVALVMLIACGNVAILLLAQATDRYKEIAIRSAIGATGGRITRQLLTESLLLSLLGGAGGLLLAAWGVRVLKALDLGNVPRLGEVSLDASVLLFTLAVSLLTGILFGLAPAFQALKTNLQAVLKEGGKTSGGGGSRNPLRTLLVVAQIAIAVVVLVTAGLMVRTMSQLERVDPGFRTDGVVTLQLFLSMIRYQQPQDRLGYYHRLMAELDSVPEVELPGLISHLPLAGIDFRREITIEGYEPPAASSPTPLVGWRFVSPKAFEALGIELLEGRAFNDLDTWESAGVVIVDQAMAKRYWPGQSAVGRQLRLNARRAPFNQMRTVVGVVRHIKHQNLTVSNDEQLYLPYPQFPYPVVALAIKARTEDPMAAARAVREAALRIDPSQPLSNIQPMEDVVSHAVSRPRFNRLLFGFFGIVALVLVSVGVYGVMSYTAAQRSREMGLRLALGASRRQILTLVLRQGMTLAAWGLAAGLALTYLLGRTYEETLSEILFGVRAFDPATILGVVLLVTLLAFGANLLPAFRATRVNPLTVLREE